MFSIAVASGKGGTGKTTISTNLARLFVERFATQYVDCDVEAPNGHLFLKPGVRQAMTVCRPVPAIDESACTHCGVCGDFCRFHALAVLSNRVLVFPELCHGCGGCAKVCDAGAVLERELPIGTIEFGQSGRLAFAGGRLAVGETASVRLIRELRRRTRPHEITILDAPPGTTCPVVATVRGVDAVVLVAEPTPFGLHDLRLAVEMGRQLEIPMGVVINRDGVGDERVAEYCAAERLPVWARIPEDRRVAEAYARGELACEVVPAFRRRLEQLAACLMREAAA
jgi:MinD superfamily P-loop ATPase